MFNSLVKKNEKFDYVGELASDIKRSDDNVTFTFTLHDGVKFHDGRALTRQMQSTPWIWSSPVTLPNQRVFTKVPVRTEKVT